MRSGKLRCFLLLLTALCAVLVITGCGSSYTAPYSPPPPPPPPPDTTVTVTPATATVFRGETVQFSAQVSGPSDKTVTWSVPSGLGTIDSSGLSASRAVAVIREFPFPRPYRQPRSCICTGDTRDRRRGVRSS
jgi:hypothetical protein